MSVYLIWLEKSNVNGAHMFKATFISFVTTIIITITNIIIFNENEKLNCSWWY